MLFKLYSDSKSSRSLWNVLNLIACFWLLYDYWCFWLLLIAIADFFVLNFIATLLSCTGFKCSCLSLHFSIPTLMSTYMSRLCGFFALITWGNQFCDFIFRKQAKDVFSSLLVGKEKVDMGTNRVLVYFNGVKCYLKIFSCFRRWKTKIAKRCSAKINFYTGSTKINSREKEYLSLKISIIINSFFESRLLQYYVISFDFFINKFNRESNFMSFPHKPQLISLPVSC